MHHIIFLLWKLKLIMKYRTFLKWCLFILLNSMQLIPFPTFDNLAYIGF